MFCFWNGVVVVYYRKCFVICLVYCIMAVFFKNNSLTVEFNSYVVSGFPYEFQFKCTMAYKVCPTWESSPRQIVGALCGDLNHSVIHFVGSRSVMAKMFDGKHHNAVISLIATWSLSTQVTSLCYKRVAKLRVDFGSISVKYRAYNG